MPADFQLKRRGFRSPQRSLEQSSRTAGLVESYALSLRAGKAVAPVIKAMGLALDYETGRGVRIENNKAVFITDSAAQLSRLRNLSKRLLEKLVADGVPVLGVEFRLRGRRAAEEEAEKTSPVRTPSIIAAAELLSAAEKLINPELREQIRALAHTLEPNSEELPLAVLTAITAQHERLEKLGSEIKGLREKLPHAPDPHLVPEEAAAAASEELAGVRGRMLKRIARRAVFEKAANGADAERKALLPMLNALESRAMAGKEEEAVDFPALRDEVIAFARRLSATLRSVKDARERLTAQVEEERQKKESAHEPSKESDEERALALRAGLSAPPPNMALREQLRGSLARLLAEIRVTKKALEKARDRLPPAGNILAGDETLAADVARLAEARKKGEKAPEEALSPRSSRLLLIWNSRSEIEEKLSEAFMKLGALEKTLESDRPKLRVPRSFSASALASDFAELRKIDLRRPEDESALNALSSESEYLQEAAEMLRTSLPDGELPGENPVEVRLEALAGILREHLRNILSALGISPNESIIPTEAEAAASPETSALRERQLARLSLWRERRALVQKAEDALKNFSSVLSSPRDAGEKTSRSILFSALEKSLANAFELAEAARREAAPKIPVLTIESADAERTRREEAEKAAKEREAEEKSKKAAKAPKPPEAAPGSLEEKLQILRDILPVWKERLPRAPDPNLIPSEADAARREDLREIRSRMLLRRANHEAFTQEFDELSGLLAQVEGMAANPLADGTETERLAQKLDDWANDFSARLAKL
ncbi:hypothetical protein [uncultured Sutterella sp.]|uniref:hypothetical protein n=1 Tax=uncultured Sutterella sp. TaxID=286133 RepID=UPI002612D238|nr:hypothetical protein [uncultured Sutterella sp.]